jgi:hypothetical protein
MRAGFQFFVVYFPFTLGKGGAAKAYRSLRRCRKGSAEEFRAAAMRGVPVEALADQATVKRVTVPAAVAKKYWRRLAASTYQAHSEYVGSLSYDGYRCYPAHRAMLAS